MLRLLRTTLALLALGYQVLGFTIPSTKSVRAISLIPTQSNIFDDGSLIKLASQSDAAAETASITILEEETKPMEQNFTVTFPPLLELQDVRRGDFLASAPIQIGDHEFRVLLYPRGGGHSSSFSALKNQNDDKKEASDILAMFQKDASAKDDRVGVYLQYLPKSEQDTVDATFNLRLKGRQSSGPRFDVDWTAGMRFVAPNLGNLKEGTANDFGAHLMQSNLLEFFLGGPDSEEKLDVEVKVQIHPSESTDKATDVSISGSDNSLISFKDIRETDDPNVHDTDKVRVGKIVVPILQRLAQRPRMFELGAYPGVEYRIMRILDPETKEDIFTSVPNAEYELKPIYSLVPQLERQWPVRVNEKELPKLYTQGMYNAISALGSLFTAVAGLTTAFIISQLISLFFIPSKSMDPTLRVGDVLLVEKVTPRIQKNNQVGDVVLFHPNQQLQDIVKASGGRPISDRDLFVKRVAATAGDLVSVDAAGSVKVNGVPASGQRDLCEEEPLRLIQRYVQPVDNLEIKKDQVFLMGDCSSVSVDSRVWGPLDKEDIVGKPILRIWPFERMGSVPAILTNSEQIIVEESSMATQWSD